jgi:hypothetical protein
VTVKKQIEPVGLPAVREVSVLQPQREVMTEAKIIEAFDAMGITAKLSQPQKRLFIAIAREFQLNPLRREIHAVQMGGDDGEGGTLVPVVGYEVYIDRAESTGRLEYWHLEETGEIDPNDWRKSTYRVTTIIKRRDWPKEFRWTVRYVEAIGLKYNKTKGTQEPNAMWRKRGHFMTQKCTIGQGFRLVFREILRGMPYVDAEIENATNGEVHEEEKGELRPPQMLPDIVERNRPPGTEPPMPTTSDPKPVSVPQGPYAEIMTTLRERVQSKEGPMIALFDSHENMEWKLKADESRKSPDELQGVQQELESIAAIRRQKVKEGV